MTHLDASSKPVQYGDDERGNVITQTDALGHAVHLGSGNSKVDSKETALDSSMDSSLRSFRPYRRYRRSLKAARARLSDSKSTSV